MRLLPRATLLTALAGWLLLAGCIPYAVGTTAATVPVRTVAVSGVFQVASVNRALDVDDRDGGPTASFGNEARVGLTPRSDVGLRIQGLGSFGATYKHRLSGRGEEGTAVIVGGGVVSKGWLYGEATVVVSGRSQHRIVPYGGLRVQAMSALSDDVIDVGPAVGAFGGGRFGWRDLALSPELGVFYNPSTLARDGDWIVVPSVTVHGDRLLRALGL